MNLKVKEVRQSEYRSQDYPMVHVAAIYKAYNTILANEFRHLDVTPQMWRILAILQVKDGYSLGHLSEITLIEQSHLSRIIDSMERDALLERQPQTRDKRIKLVCLTKKGHALFEQLLPTVLTQYDKTLAGFDKEEIGKLMEFLGRIRVNLNSNI